MGCRGTLPQVSFYKPVGVLNPHPSYTDLISGDEHVDDLLTWLRNGPQWNRMLVVVTYEENAGSGIKSRRRPVTSLVPGPASPR